MKVESMPTGGLTPASNETKVERRYAGGFGQPDGFEGMMKIRINTSGRLEIHIYQRNQFGSDDIECVGIGLSNEQRLDLAKAILEWAPVKAESML